jgi:hypothetical protein
VSDLLVHVFTTMFSTSWVVSLDALLKAAPIRLRWEFMY